MSQRAEIVNRIAKASSLQEQARLVSELDAYDRLTREASAQERSIDLTDTIVRETLQPHLAHERSTIETDWLGDISTTASQDTDSAQAAQAITVEAAMWYRRLSPEVKADREEFAEQARGMARRTASVHGEQAPALEREFLTYVSFLHSREAASGLPQVQQTVDAFENSAPTDLPQQTFDNFAPLVWEGNAAATGTESSERAPLINLVTQEGGSPVGAPTHHDTAPQPYTYAEVPPGGPQDASYGSEPPLPNDGPGGGQGQDPDDALDKQAAQVGYGWGMPTVAINHSMTLDDFRQMSHEAASGLDQVQQVVDSFEEPDETSLPTDVAFPWEITPDAGGQAQQQSGPQEPQVNPSVVNRQMNTAQGQERMAALQRQAAYVASLSAKDPRTLTETERKEIAAFASYMQKAASFPVTADQWSQTGQQWPMAPGNTPANSPMTTPDPIGGSEAAGRAEGRTDWPGEAPDFSDVSPSIPPYAKGHAEGYQDAMHANPNPGGMEQLPPGVGGMGTYLTHAGSLQGTTASLQVEAAGTATCASCGKQDKTYNMVQRGNGHSVDHFCSTCSPTAKENKDFRWQGSLRVSASFVSPMDEADAEFTKAYKYASRWEPGKRLVTQGSAAFEAGLYAGISDNQAHQEKWVEAHRRQASKYDKPEFLSRIAKHREFSKQACETMPGFVVQGSYLTPIARKTASKTAGTELDLDTTAPQTSPSPTGDTPINGPGEPGPLAGGSQPAAPGGPSPYNGAAPYGSPVVPNPATAHGTPTAISTVPGAAVDQAALEHLSPQTLSFRRRVQASLLAARQEK